MKRAGVFCLVAVAFATTLAITVNADPTRRERAGADAALPVNDILNAVRETGLEPLGQPVRRGQYAVLRAVDPRGIEMRVLADAQRGDLVSVTPVSATNDNDAPPYGSAPHIIHVPQPGERQDVRRVQSRRDRSADSVRAKAMTPAPDADDEDDNDDAPPAAPQTATRKAPEPLPMRQRRTVLSIPPQQDGPSPVYPTPRWQTQVEEFGKPPVLAPAAVPPAAPTGEVPAPPPGYTPPADPRN